MMIKLTCKDCKHYLRHYAKNGFNFHPVFCGHCTNRTKRGFRKTDKICEEFEQRELGEEKEKLLSKATDSLRNIANLMEKMVFVLNELQSDILVNEE